MKIVPVMIIALFAASAIAACKQSEQRHPALLKEQTQEKGLSREPYYYGLIEEYRRVLDEDPHNRAATVALANAYYDSGSWRQAILYYERALVLDPHDPDILTDLGTSYRNGSMPDRALQCYQKALRQNPDHLNARYNMGIVYAYDKKDYRRAVQEWEHLLRIAPTFPHAEKVRNLIASFKKRIAGGGGS